MDHAKFFTAIQAKVHAGLGEAFALLRLCILNKQEGDHVSRRRAMPLRTPAMAKGLAD
jgi:hypothetical protein